MSYGFLANAAATTHITTILAVFIGLLISFRFKRFRFWEAGILISVIVLWSYYGNCPLTILEQYFRDLAGQSANLTSVGFLPYYANKLIGVGLSSKLVQQTTFFAGGMFFAASIEWLSPLFHFHLFHFRKSFRKSLKKLFV